MQKHVRFEIITIEANWTEQVYIFLYILCLYFILFYTTTKITCRFSIPWSGTYSRGLFKCMYVILLYNSISHNLNKKCLQKIIWNFLQGILDLASLDEMQFLAWNDNVTHVTSEVLRNLKNYIKSTKIKDTYRHASHSLFYFLIK